MPYESGAHWREEKEEEEKDERDNGGLKVEDGRRGRLWV